MIDFFFWFMFPLAVLFSTFAMMSGIGGATLFSPFFLLVLGLQPVVAITAGLFVELFGFSSGLIAFLRRRLVNFHVVRRLLPVVLIGVGLGVILRTFVGPFLLTLLLSLLLFTIAFLFLTKKKLGRPLHPSHLPLIHLHFFHHIPHIKLSVRFSTFMGAIMAGAVSSGLGEVNEYNFNERLKLPFAVAAGTSIFLVAAGAVLGALPHLFLLFTQTPEIARIVTSVLVFTIPGVIIGAQIGAALSKKVELDFIEHLMGILFIIIGFALLYSLV